LLAEAPETHAEAAALAWLPRIDDRIAGIAAGAGALDRLMAAGLPLRRRADGWLELPDPIRDALRAAAPALPTATIHAVADAYLDRGDPATALGFLVRAGDPDALAGTLAARSWHELTPLDATELRAALATLPDDVVARHPRVLLAAARVAESGVHLAWRTALLERARTLPAADADPVLRREVLVEQAADASRAGDVDATVPLAEEVLAGAGHAESRTRAIALTALGRIDAFSRDPLAMARAADRLGEAVSLLRPLPEPDLLRGTLQVLGYGVHFARGDLDPAIDALREAADLVPGAIRTRAGVQTFLADALVAAGRLDDAEAVLRDELGVARRLRDDRLLAYHAWMQASIASRRGDGAAVEAWLAEAERHPADWFAHPTGIEFLADAVDFLGRAGLDEEAARTLTRVEARCAAGGHEDIDQIALVARAVFGARAGDPIAAERDLVACLAIEQVAPREHWRIHLLRGLAAARAGDAGRAERHARRAFGMAAAMGHPDLPRILEPGIAAVLEPLLARTGDAPDAPDVLVGSAPRVRIRVLGRFEAVVDGRPADLPEGKPSQLVKLLAVTGRAMPIDEVVEALWPDADPDLGRQRLRNVLARVRGACGDLVVRTEEALSLERDTEVDLARFEADARAALAEPAVAGEALARAALGRYAGELLPGDRYEDFTAAARERVAVRHVALLDRLAALTAERGDVDEALTLLEEAIAAEPLDERRYRTAITVAARHGRRDRAVRLADRAVAMEADLADEPSEELVALLADLGLRVREGRSGN
jgi:DNA-binding SARP family transcriptional activator